MQPQHPQLALPAVEGQEIPPGEPTSLAAAPEIQPQQRVEIAPVDQERVAGQPPSLAVTGEEPTTVAAAGAPTDGGGAGGVDYGSPPRDQVTLATSSPNSPFSRSPHPKHQKRAGPASPSTRQLAKTLQSVQIKLPVGRCLYDSKLHQLVELKLQHQPTKWAHLKERLVRPKDALPRVNVSREHQDAPLSQRSWQESFFSQSSLKSLLTIFWVVVTEVSQHPSQPTKLAAGAYESGSRERLFSRS